MLHETGLGGVVIDPRRHDTLSRAGSGGRDGEGGCASPPMSIRVVQGASLHPTKRCVFLSEVTLMSVQPDCHAAALATREGGGDG